MFALVENVYMPGSNTLDRFLCAISGNSGIIVDEDISLGVRMLRIKIPVYTESDRAAARRARLAARGIFHSGIRKAVYPQCFNYKHEFEQMGTREPAPAPLYRELAFSMCETAARKHGFLPQTSSAVVFAYRLTRQVENAVLRLCGKTRHISLLVERGADGFIGALRRDTGVSIVGRRIDSFLNDTDIFLLFDKPDALPPPSKENSAVIMLYDGAEKMETLNVYTDAKFSIPAKLRPVWPGECDSNSLMAALFESGGLKTENLKILDIV